jgi:hypothetical protein
MAVIIRIAISTPPPTRGRGRWKMNTRLMDNNTFRERLAVEWTAWKRTVQCFPSKTWWWNQYVKRKIKIICTSVGTELNTDRRDLENIYYTAIHSLLYEDSVSVKRLTKLNELKAKILRLHRQESQKRFLDVGNEDNVAMNISLHHIIRTRKRQSRRLITNITDENGIQHSNNKDITRTFYDIYGQNTINKR